MADTPSAAPGAAPTFDLSQFYQIFFEEAAENLDQMEQMLLHIDLAAADDEELNGIFRCAHSIKGGAATFGFSDVAELTHHMESLLDRVRRRDLTLTPPMVDVLLLGADASRSMMARHQAGGVGESMDTADLAARIRAMAGQEAGAQPVAEEAAEPAAAASGLIHQVMHQAKPQAMHQVMHQVMPQVIERPPLRQLALQVGPLDSHVAMDGVRELLRSIPGLGPVSERPGAMPATRVFDLETASSNDDLLDLLEFHVPRDKVQWLEVAWEMAGQRAASPPESSDTDTAVPAAVAPAVEMDGDDSFGFFVGAPGAPPPAVVAAPSPPAPPVPVAVSAPLADSAHTRGPAAPVVLSAPSAALDAGTLRVGVHKVDQLINLVGELVITQAMLAQNSSALDPRAHQQLLTGLADLQRNTRDLQESVMSIRMMPMSAVFNRFPRMLRDLAQRLGKQVELVSQGEATELDKSLVEKITDPLTHLVRNSCDHGIETPAERMAAGKPAHGTITLAASHQGGAIMIEVHDDGRGLSRERILRKAIERGVQVPPVMSDLDVWNLVFEPGFSTAETVTDVSGRGVGMDVVKRSIQALGGTVDIDSAEGYGTRVEVRLPLTLAIMDGMSVGVGDEVYILPLSCIVESFQIDPAQISTVAQDTPLVKVRDAFLPVLSLETIFEVPRTQAAPDHIIVVIEVDDTRVALLVHALLGQHQVVVKNLETHYRKVPNVSGATILGDGSVSLILDPAALVRAHATLGALEVAP